jgi:hypothetical protein
MVKWPYSNYDTRQSVCNVVRCLLQRVVTPVCFTFIFSQRWIIKIWKEILDASKLCDAYWIPALFRCERFLKNHTANTSWQIERRRYWGTNWLIKMNCNDQIIIIRLKTWRCVHRFRKHPKWPWRRYIESWRSRSKCFYPSLSEHTWSITDYMYLTQCRSGGSWGKLACRTTRSHPGM